MSDTPQIVQLIHAKTPFDAQVIAGVLGAAGIPCYVGSSLVPDISAIADTLMENQHAVIQVPADRLEDARQAMREADEASHLLDDPSFDPGPRED
jgi:hypothetical protein